MTSTPPIRTVLLVTTLLATWLVWGSSFVAISFALDGIPPLLLMASRFIAAGVLAVGFGLALGARRGAPLPPLRAWRDASLVGVGWITIGMGATGWAATRLPTGVASLLVATAPLWIAVLQLTVVRGASPSRLGLVGVGVGMLGVGALVSPSGGGSNPIDGTAALVLVAATAAWAGASLFAQRAERPDGLLLGAGMQMLTGGLMLLVAALLAGEGRLVDVAAIDARVALGWIYLVLPAAIGGFVSFGWLLANTSATTASTHAFVNPLVAVSLGAAVLGERVGAQVLVAGAGVVAAVVLLLVGEARGARTTRPVAIDQPPTATRGNSSTRPIGKAAAAGRGRRGGGWSPAPTPAFAARRTARPWHATDGMDALSIDEAFDSLD